MKYARIVKEDGSIYTNNFILDDVLDTLNKFGISNEDEKNDELIKQLTIQKFEYARRCTAQVIAQNNLTESNPVYRKLDDALMEKIIELGGKPSIKTFS